MCVYCNCGDFPFRHDPPWQVPNTHPSYPFIPQPLHPAPINPWSLERLREYYELLKAIKAMEDKIGCPCEPNKADYLKLFEERIAELEKRVGKSP